MIQIGIEYRYLYVRLQTDYDGSVYEKLLEDKTCHCDLPFVNRLLNHYRKLYNGGYYIRYNRLYFIYKGVRYWLIPSSMSDEYMFIRKFIQHLSNYGCSCFYYNGGCAD